MENEEVKTLNDKTIGAFVGEMKIISPRIIDIDKVSIDEIKKYIKSKQCILWQNWYVTDPKGLEDAANWIKSLLNELYSGIYGDKS